MQATKTDFFYIFRSGHIDSMPVLCLHACVPYDACHPPVAAAGPLMQDRCPFYHNGGEYTIGHLLLYFTKLN